MARDRFGFQTELEVKPEFGRHIVIHDESHPDGYPYLIVDLEECVVLDKYRSLEGGRLYVEELNNIG